MLILLNGIPASGKSTLARAWCERHGADLPLALDLDLIRSMLGGWRESFGEAGVAARRMALAAIREHLAAGHDVVVPQYLRRPEFIDSLASVAAETGAGFIECAMRIDPAVADARFAQRAAATASDPHGELVDTIASIAAEFEAFLRTRPRAVRIDAGQSALDDLDAVIASRR